MTVFRAFLFVGLTRFLVPTGCDDDPKGGDGVNDVRLACEIRAKWNRVGNDCTVCEAATTTERCDCVAIRDFSAACIDQHNARKAACGEAVDTCVFNCKREDCSCIDACYANIEACKRAAAARDGCITETCAPHCK
jgi:hypothetical protein